MKLFTFRNYKSFLVLFCLAFCFNATAQKTWDGSSNNDWNTPANWTPSGVPGSGDDVVININATINVNVNPTIRSLTISGSSNVSFTSSGGGRTISINNNGSTVASGSTLTLQGSTGGGTRFMRIAYTGTNRTMTIAGTLVLTDVGEGSSYIATNSLTTVTGTIRSQDLAGTAFPPTITSTVANLSFLAGGTYNHARNGGAIPTATWATTSNCNITGVTSLAPTSTGQAFGNFTWNCTGQSTASYLIETLTTINGNFTVENTNLWGLYLAETNNSTYTLNVTGNLTINNNVWLVLVYGQSNNAFGDNVQATINVGGNFSMTGANSYFDFWPSHATGGGLSLNKLSINVSGNYSQADGQFNFAAGNSDVANFTELRVGGNFSLTGAGVMGASTGDADISNGAITFNKSGTQTFTCTTPGNLVYTNFVVANNSNLQLFSNIILASDATAVWGGKFTVNTGGILDAGTNQIVSNSGLSLGQNNDFTLKTGAGIITANTGGVHQIGYAGPTISAAIATRTFSSGANYSYNGTVVQTSGTFITTPTANQVNNLTMNNTAGNTTTGVTLAQPFAVAGVLTLSNGHITTDATNLLTMNAGSSVNTQVYASRTSGGSANSFINGPMRKIGGTDFLFPVGKLTRGIRYCGISGTGTGTDSFTGEFISGSASNMAGGITVGGLSHVSKCEYWIIDRTAGTSSTNVTLSWNPASICNAAAYVTQLSSLVVAHYGTSWDSFGNDGGNTGTVSSGSVTWNAVSTFSPFSLGSTSASENPLPVKLVDVKAYNTGNRNRIEWTNLTEIDIVAYEIEKSLNGTQFTQMASVAARSNANDKESYFEYDVQPSSITYYRIKVTSRDGKIIYSPIVKVATNLIVKQDIVLYPNPVIGKQFTMQMNSAAGDYFVKIYSASGQIVKTETLEHPGGSYAKTIELPGQLQAGQYYMQVSGGEKILTSKFIVQ